MRRWAEGGIINAGCVGKLTDGGRSPAHPLSNINYTKGTNPVVEKNITPQDPTKKAATDGGGLRSRLGKALRAVGRRAGSMHWSDRNIKDHITPVVW